jgi:hypothetical protein
MSRRTRRITLLLVTLCLAPAPLSTACSTQNSDPQSSELSRTPDSGRQTDIEEPGASGGAQPPDADARVKPVSIRQWEKMEAAGVWRPGCPLTRLDLRRVEVNHWRFDGTTGRGALVVNRDVAAVIAEIFTALFDAEFPIREMRPVEHYGGDANASLKADNTSAFNCRRPDQINAPPMESPHANGRAIDINPRENPWLDLRCNCWFPTSATKARRPGPGVITKGGLVWRLFRAKGWIWQNISVPDYMHFDTGYPSKPYRAP